MFTKQERGKVLELLMYKEKLSCDDLGKLVDFPVESVRRTVAWEAMTKQKNFITNLYQSEVI